VVLILKLISFPPYIFEKKESGQLKKEKKRGPGGELGQSRR